MNFDEFVKLAGACVVITNVLCEAGINATMRNFDPESGIEGDEIVIVPDGMFNVMQIYCCDIVDGDSEDVLNVTVERDCTIELAARWFDLAFRNSLPTRDELLAELFEK